MKQNRKQTCLETLKQRVLSMELKPGELLDEAELLTEFSISRTPLREIVQRLSGEGYLVTEDNRGTKVAPMDFSTMHHFFQAAPMVYAATARLAAENATPEQVDGLKEVQRRYRKAVEMGAVSETAMLNHRFHELIGDMAASPYLMPSLARLLIDHTRISQVFYHAKSPEDSRRIVKAAAQHDAMIAAFEKHLPAEAVQLTLAHWELSRSRIEKYVRPDPLPFTLETRPQQGTRHAV